MKRYLALLILAVSAVAYGATTYTTNYNLAKPGDGDTNYGAAIRGNMDTIDTQLKTNADSVSGHISDATDAHDASAISTTVGANICTTSTDVQAYLTCLDGVYDPEVSGVVLTTGDQTIAGVKTFSAAPAFSSVPNTMIRSGSGGTVTATTFTAESPATDKGDLMAHDGAELIRLPAGTNGDLLTANSAEDTGLEWVSTLPAANGGTGVSSTATFPASGVVVTEAGTQTLTNKTLGSTNTITGATAASFTVSGSTVTLPPNTTTLVGRGTTDTLTNKSIDGATNTITNVSLSTGTTGTLAVGRGGTGQTSALAAFDALSPNTTKGDITVRDSTNNIRVAVGTNGQVLTADSTTPSGVKWGDSGAGGSGEINANTNPSAASATTGYSNGTSHTISRVTSGSPLDPVTPTALSISATANTAESATSGSYYSIDSMPSGLFNRKLKVEFYYTAATAADTWALSVYAGATRMSLSTDSSGATTIPSGVTGGKFTTTFDADSSTAYTVNITRTAGSGTTTLIFTNMVVGPGIQPQGAVVGPWTTFTAVVTSTGTAPAFGTNTQLAKWRRVGADMEIVWEYSQTVAGTTGTGNYRFAIPSGYTIDTTGMTLNGGNDSRVGEANLNSTSRYDGWVSVASSTTVLANFFNDTTARTDWGASLGGFGAAAVTRVALNIKVPIAEWAGSGTLNVAQNDVEYACASGTWDANSTTTSYGPAGCLMGGALTAARDKTMTFGNIQSTDTFELQVSNDQIVWLPFNGGAACSGSGVTVLTRSAAGSIGSGATWIKSSATAIAVTFAQFCSMANDDAPTQDWGNDKYWRLVKRSGGQAVGLGLATSTSAGLVNPYSANGIVVAGNYVPTLTGTANVAASTAGTAHYIRVGANVMVSGEIAVDPTTTATFTTINVSLPFASALTALRDCTGNVTLDQGSTVASIPGWADADAANDLCQLNVTVATDVTNRSWWYNFQYEIK